MRYNKNQLDVYRGVLKNKNLSSILTAGFNAPLGSTKRKQAQKVLSVIKKTTMDGKGGPGPRIPRVNVQLRHDVVDYSNFLILPSTPPIRVKFGEKAPTPKSTVHDGQGYSPFDTGPGMVSTPYNPGGPSYSRLDGAKMIWDGTKYIADKTYTTQMGLMNGAARAGWGTLSTVAPMLGDVSGLTRQQPITSRTMSDPRFANAGQQTPAMVNVPGLAAANVAAQGPTTFGLNNTPAPKNDRNAVQLGTKNMPYGSTAIEALTRKPMPQQLPGLMSSLNSTQNATDPNGGTMTGSTDGATDGSTTETPMEETITSPFQSSQFAGVQAAVDAGMGPTMFAYNALSQGGDALKTIMPGASKSMLAGGGLYDRLKQIEDQTRKSYGLDQLEGQMRSLVMSGQGLEGRLTDYIRGRDEFLNETEDSIKDLKRMSMTMDMSDPRNRANMDQHFNYLYEMRGRQNKRYVEFVKMSVDSYAQRIDRAKMFYDDTVSRYAKDVLNNQEMFKEEYNVIFQGLKETYDNVSNAERDMYELDILQSQALKARQDIVSDAIDANGVISGDYEALYKQFKGVNFIGDNGEWIINNNALSVAGANRNKLGELLDEASAKALLTYTKGENGSVSTSPVPLSKATEVINNVLGHLIQLRDYNVISTDEFDLRKNNVLSHLSRNLKDNGGFIPDEQIPSYREAIKSLAPKWFAAPDRAKFLSKNQGLDSTILNSIFTEYEAYGKNNGAQYVNDFFTTRGDLGQGGGASFEQNSALRNLLIDDYYMKSLKPAKINGSPNFNKVGGGTNSASGGTRAQRNNNPLNIKYSDFTKTYAGVSGIDPKPASDGGNFLQFSSAQEGFEAAKKLLAANSYRNLTVDAAMRRWSGNGYGGEVLPSAKNRTVGSLTPNELQILVQNMAKAEGFYS